MLDYLPGESLSLTVNFDEMDDKTVTLTYHHDSYFEGYTMSATGTLHYTITDTTTHIGHFCYI